EIAEDKDAYYLPAFISTAIAAGFGIRWLNRLSAAKLTSVAARYAVAAIAIVLVPVTALASNWPFNNRRHYFIAHDYVENILGSMERGSLLLTLDWQVASPMFYTREIENLRPDVKVVDINLLRRSWYFDYLRHAYHDLIFQLEEDRTFHDPGPLHLETRGLGDGTLKFEPDDVVTLKVFPAYKTMLVNRARYFSYFNQRERAIEAFTSALALDPKLEL